MDETRLLLSRVDDLIESSSWDDSCFLGFLNEHEAAITAQYLKNKGVSYEFYGGYTNATRVYLSLSDLHGHDNYPITALKVSSKGTRNLTHRDFLGSIMGMGLKRECVGDIVLLSDKEAAVFVRTELAEHIISNLLKVGHEPVSVTEFTGDRDKLCLNFEELRLFVSSMRTDNIVAACANCSRSTAVELISTDKVFVNSLLAVKPSGNISSEDVVSIRGYGKYVIGEICGKTKKDRLILTVLHYI